jgi:uncharacterized protein YcfJ
MNAILKTTLAIAAIAITAQVTAQVSFYEDEGFQGRYFITQKPVDNLLQYGFNDRASSVWVIRDRWEVCQDAGYLGRCVVLRAGRYPSLAAMGMNDRVSSMRIVNANMRVEDNRYAPVPMSVYDSHRRQNERLYEAAITSVRAVMGPTEQRCWIERERVPQDPGSSNVPGAIIGAVIGGILGHQVGGGRGKDLATVGGVIAGGAVGATVGRNSGQPQMQNQNVQRCTSVPNQTRPAYWEVTYNFHGQAHAMQMTTPPGPTVIVNRRGEPRS